MERSTSIAKSTPTMLVLKLSFCRAHAPTSRAPCSTHSNFHPTLVSDVQNGMRLSALMEEVDPGFVLHADTEEVM